MKEFSVMRVLIAIAFCGMVVGVAFGDQRLVVAEGQGWKTEGFAKEVCQIYPCIEGGYLRRSYHPGFYTIEAGPGAFTFLQFGAVSFFVPPVGELIDGQVFGPVVSDDEFVTTVNVFAGAPTTLSVEVGGVPQRCDVAPPVTQCVVGGFLYVGSLTLRKSPGVGCPGCEADKLYGFVAVGSRRGGSVRVIPFGE